MIYEIENEPREDKPIYDGAGLPACKARARRLSAKSGDMVYILASRSFADSPCGHIAFADGRLDHVEGDVK